MSAMPRNTTNDLPTLDELRTAVAEIMGSEPEEIPGDANLVHLGLDSLGMMRLVNRWRRGGMRVSSRTLASEPTLEAWHRHLKELREASENERTDSPPGRSQPR
jgi:aryl carrier-like protein